MFRVIFETEGKAPLLVSEVADARIALQDAGAWVAVCKFQRKRGHVIIYSDGEELARFYVVPESES